MSKYRRRKVLFVCIGNACRSPMAEAIARVDAYDVIDAFSAGLTPAGIVTESTKQTLKRNGCWAEDLESKSISPKVWEYVDLVINMSGLPRELVFNDYSKVKDWNIEDPHGKDPATHQRVFEELRLRLLILAQECREHLKQELGDAPRPAGNWASPLVSSPNVSERSDAVFEKKNPRLEAANVPRSENVVNVVSASPEVASKQEGASPLSPGVVSALKSSPTAHRTYTRTGTRPIKKSLWDRWKLLVDRGSLGVLRQRWGTLLVLGSLVGLILWAAQSVTLQHKVRSETTASSTQKRPVSGQVMKSMELPSVAEASSVPNPQANKTPAQTSTVEPLSIEELDERIHSLQEEAKRSGRPPSIAKRSLPATTVKTPSRPVASALTPGKSTPGKSTNALSNISGHANISPLAKTPKPDTSGLLSTPPQLATNTAEPVVPALRPSSDVRPPEPENKASPLSVEKQPAVAANITGAVTIHADPYPTLRMSNGSSKKQRQATSLQLGHLLSRVEPVYPENAKQQGIQGTVKLHAIIDRHGSVQSLQSVNGHPVLTVAAMNAVKQWRFSETLLAGQSVETEEDIDIVFRLSNGGAQPK